MTTTIDNLIILGDSLSDIGNKRESYFGMIARAFRLMRTNAIGRYSDGKNWTDFLWEWSGSTSLVQTDQDTTYANSTPHRNLTRDSNRGSSFGAYVNYAEGGAMGASDRPATGLGTMEEQVVRYVKQRREVPLKGETLHVIWFGLNDLVTNNRDPETMDKVVDAIGTGMSVITKHLGANNHFLVVNLPSPASATRIIEKNDLAEAARFHRGAEVFNHHLSNLPGATVVDMFNYLAGIESNLPAHGLREGSQPTGVPVYYGHGVDPAANLRDFVTTSDKAHPTEKMYKLIGKKIAQTLLTKYALGTLSRSPLSEITAPRFGAYELGGYASLDRESGYASLEVEGFGGGGAQGHWTRRGGNIIVHGA